MSSSSLGTCPGFSVGPWLLGNADRLPVWEPCLFPELDLGDQGKSEDGASKPWLFSCVLVPRWRLCRQMGVGG